YNGEKCKSNVCGCRRYTCPTMTRLKATVDGIDIASANSTFNIMPGSLTTVLKLEMREPCDYLG
ncbi:MAG TPA: hypothetical protein PKI17_07030, partial [Syntrophomonas sp.]|nr:hypothetical protein [Syntrophomonas sp.]